MEGLKDLRVPLRLPQMMTAAGFVDVDSRMLPLHTCAWSTGNLDPMSHDRKLPKLTLVWLSDPRDNQIGAAYRENIQRLLSSLATYPFTERLE